MNENEIYRKYGIKEINLEQYSLAPDMNGWGYPQQRLINVKLDYQKFEELLQKAEKCEEWNKNHYEDMFVREKVPAVKQAYEKYKMFLELARSETNDRFN